MRKGSSVMLHAILWYVSFPVVVLAAVCCVRGFVGLTREVAE
jgi:hypothetical protein